jgi:hypothetical protein
MSKKLGRKKREKIEFDKWEKELFANKSTDFNTDKVSIPDDDADKFDNDKFLKKQEAEDALHYKDNDDKYYRFFKIPYSEDDAITEYKAFKDYSAKAFNLNSKKKIKKFAKKFKWYDSYYFEKFMRMALDIKDRKTRIKEQNLFFILSELDRIEIQLDKNQFAHYQNQLILQVEELLNNADPNYIKAFQHWATYCAIQYFYEGHAVDSCTQPTCDTLLKFSNELKNARFADAAKTFATSYLLWWD